MLLALGLQIACDYHKTAGQCVISRASYTSDACVRAVMDFTPNEENEASSTDVGQELLLFGKSRVGVQAAQEESITNGTVLECRRWTLVSGSRGCKPLIYEPVDVELME